MCMCTYMCVSMGKTLPMSTCVFIILLAKIYTYLEICFCICMCVHCTRIHKFTGRGSFIHLTNTFGMTNMYKKVK